eukprot:COSAG02_NODE_129_length_34796_cov_26.576015_16_plen_66_part_00
MAKEMGANLHQCTVLIVVDPKAPLHRKMTYLIGSILVAMFQCTTLSTIMVATQYPSCLDNTDQLC